MPDARGREVQRIGFVARLNSFGVLNTTTDPVPYSDTGRYEATTAQGT